ncbi:MAG: hypothetical protein FVQ80_10545 [Planctomycetes bacterium]|nr:hypothetical protein [Planctomycetota bacterium]
MQDFLGQIFLLARGNKSKGEGLMQLLVFVGMAVFWIVGGIAKARANKIKDSDFPEEEGAEDESPKPAVQRQISRPVPKAAAVSTGRKVVEKRSVSKLGLRGSSVETVKLQKIGDAKEAVGKSMAEELFGGLHEADELKRAILYAEILGKPLSLRENF